MDPNEAIGAGSVITALIVSFFAVRVVLKYNGWDSRGRLLADTWKVWFTWVISTIVICVLMFLAAEMSPTLRSLSFEKSSLFSVIYWAVVFIGNLLAVAVAIRVTTRPERPGLELSATGIGGAIKGFEAWNIAGLSVIAAYLPILAAVILASAYNFFLPPDPSVSGFELYH